MIELEIQERCWYFVFLKSDSGQKQASCTLLNGLPTFSFRKEHFSPSNSSPHLPEEWILTAGRQMELLPAESG